MALLGLRVKEAVSLRLQDINFETNTLTVRAEISKTGVERRIYIHLNIKQILQSYIKKHKHSFNEGHIFFSQKKSKKHLLTDGFGRSFRKVLKESSLDEIRFVDNIGRKFHKLSPYCFRRAFCRELRIKNPEEPLENLAKVTGHKSLDVLNNFYIKLEERPVQERLLNKTFTE